MIQAVKLDLDRRMRDVKLLVKVAGDPGKKGVARMPGWHHQMHRQRSPGRVRGPDMQIMHRPTIS